MLIDRSADIFMSFSLTSFLWLTVTAQIHRHLARISPTDWMAPVTARWKNHRNLWQTTRHSPTHSPIYFFQNKQLRLFHLVKFLFLVSCCSCLFVIIEAFVEKQEKGASFCDDWWELKVGRKKAEKDENFWCGIKRWRMLLFLVEWLFHCCFWREPCFFVGIIKADHWSKLFSCLPPTVLSLLLQSSTLVSLHLQNASSLFIDFVHHFAHHCNGCFILRILSYLHPSPTTLQLILFF